MFLVFCLGMVAFFYVISDVYSFSILLSVMTASFSMIVGDFILNIKIIKIIAKENTDKNSIKIVKIFKSTIFLMVFTLYFDTF